MDQLFAQRQVHVRQLTMECSITEDIVHRPKISCCILPLCAEGMTRWNISRYMLYESTSYFVGIIIRDIDEKQHNLWKWPIRKHCSSIQRTLGYIGDLFHHQWLTNINAWAYNGIHSYIWDLIVHPCPFLNGGFTRLPLVPHICVSELGQP